MYDIVFVTNQPSFYKIRQWNEIGKRKRVLILFLEWMEKDRNKDFISENPEFEYIVLPKGILRNLCVLFSLIWNHNYSRLILGGWDDWRLLLLPFFSKKKKNAFICESSIYEYHPHFLRDAIKRLFLTRISIVYPSGLAQGRIFEHFRFSGEYKYTGGCGLLNYISQPPFQPRTAVKNFLFVGRLVEVKNLQLLIGVFNQLPHLHLDIIGYGIQEPILKKMSKGNIHFLGAVANKELSTYYQQADVFVLPSISEPWGLVVEEALNNGTPVIVSDKVGCRDDLVTNETGFVFSSGNEKSLMSAILQMTNIACYNQLRNNISRLDFQLRARRQVEVFI